MKLQKIVIEQFKKSMSRQNQQAFTLLEVLISMAIIGIIGVLVFSIQGSTWKVTTTSNRTLVAGHMVDRQIEQLRMDISKNQTLNFPPDNGSVSENGIKLTWVISDAARPTDGANLPNVRKCDFTASWGKARTDTLKVATYLSKMF